MIYSSPWVKLIHKLDSWGFFNKKVFNDMNLEWFSEVGTEILILIMIAVVNPALIYFIKTIVFRCLKKWRAGGAKTQKDYIQRLMPLRFDLERRYALTINLIFICSLFLTGIPLVAPFCFFSLLILFFIEKYVFTTFTIKPPVYSKQILSLISKLMPVSALFSTAFALYFMGSDVIFPLSEESNELVDDFLVVYFVFQIVNWRCTRLGKG